MGYHQVEMDPSDIDKTAFSTKQGHWAYRKMPFALLTAPDTFMRLMNTVLSVLTGARCFVFLEIILYANNLAELDAKLPTVLGSLRQYSLKLQPDKCEFLRKEVSYLGHVISEDGVRPDHKKTESIKKLPIPKTAKQL
jgi:hypothetical protein